jgi:carbon starvation protein
MTAGYQKIFSPDPALGFLAQAERLAGSLAAGTIPSARTETVRAQIFNLRLDAALAAVFMSLVGLIVAEASRVWWRSLRGPEPTSAALAPVEG